jgi:hydrogenase maturation protein HypF
MFRALVDDLIRGTSPAIVSGRFHATIASMVAEMCERIRSKMGLNTVALSGGCFQNRILFRYTSNRLEGRGFEVLMHSQVPCNDGGLSLGQAAIAAAKRQDERGSV